jgi:hypothetical protein
MTTTRTRELAPSRGRVVHLTTVHLPFDIRIFHKEAKSLVRAGYDIVLVAQHGADETIDNVRVVALPKPRNRFTRALCLSWKAYRLARKSGAVVYHIHDPELLPWAWLLQRMSHSSAIYDVHEYHAESIQTKEWIPQAFRAIAAHMDLLRTGIWHAGWQASSRSTRTWHSSSGR